ncbi:MAG: hypothetical protein IT379_08440 [Deltaproteobacteria bacterium]|nr:hypothetical protein [Deltaproteobacteria bacterium]
MVVDAGPVVVADRPNRGGRPRKGEGPRVPYEELDRILVFGEVVPCEDGNGTTVVFPSYRELADRYGVSHSVVADYAKSRNVQRRRKEALARVQVKAEQKLVEARATAIAYSKDDELRIIDGYLSGFETALAEGRVRFDNPADFNTMVRLKEFVQGNADSRQEIHASLSLEVLQARHRQMIRAVDVTAEERGVVAAGALPSQSTEATVGNTGDPPAAPPEDPPQKPAGRFPGRFAPPGTPREVVDFTATRAAGGDDDAPAETQAASARGHVVVAASGDVGAAERAVGVCAGGSERVPRGPACSSASELGSSVPTTRSPTSRGLPSAAEDDESADSRQEEHPRASAGELVADDDAMADTLRPPAGDPEGSCE